MSPAPTPETILDAIHAADPVQHQVLALDALDLPSGAWCELHRGLIAHHAGLPAGSREAWDVAMQVFEFLRPGRG